MRRYLHSAKHGRALHRRAGAGEPVVVPRARWPLLAGAAGSLLVHAGIAAALAVGLGDSASPEAQGGHSTTVSLSRGVAGGGPGIQAAGAPDAAASPSAAPASTAAPSSAPQTAPDPAAPEAPAQADTPQLRRTAAAEPAPSTAAASDTPPSPPEAKPAPDRQSSPAPSDPPPKPAAKPKPPAASDDPQEPAQRTRTAAENAAQKIAEAAQAAAHAAGNAAQDAGAEAASDESASAGSASGATGPNTDKTSGKGAGDPDAAREGAGGGGDSARPVAPKAGNPPPDYPRVARRRGWEGRVVLAITVSPEGTVAALEVVESSGHAVLDRAARRAVRDWRFRPAERLGRPVRDRIRVPIAFQLQSG